MRILLANHTGAWSGAEVALLLLARALHRRHAVAVACPPGGPLAAAVTAAGIELLPIPEAQPSLRLDLVQTSAGLARLAAGGVALARAAREVRADVLHANTLRTGLMAAVAGRLGGPPVVVRAHEALPATAVGRAARLALVRSSAAVVAVSDHTARAFDAGLRRPVATRVYNAIDHECFDPRRVAPAPLRAELGLGPDARLLGQVGQITPWKGQDTAVRALALLRETGVDAHLVIVGAVAFGGRGVRFDNHAYQDGLERLVAESGLTGRVHFLGQRADVPAVLRALDLTLVPSWSEPFGLVTVESMAMGVPPLVTRHGGSAELVRDELTGRVLPPHRPSAWAAAAGALLADADALARMGEHARVAAAAFHAEVQAAQMLAVYERVGAAGARSRGAHAFAGRVVGPVAPW